MYEKLEECPSCKHPKFSNYYIITDYSISDESFALVKCDKCKLIFTNPRPSEENIGKFYQSEDYISHTNKANNLTNFLYKKVRSITLKEKIQLLKSYTDRNKLLDFGCGTGAFLNHTLKNKFDSIGYETDPSARAIAEKTSETKILADLKSLQKVKGLDIITAWHVIEHVHKLRNTLNTLRKCLSDDGYLFIALPNPNSYDAELYKEFWAGYDVPRHLYHFTKKSFTQLAHKCKLEVKEIHPMTYDAYYVSLLSEKYKTGKIHYFKSFLTGLKSNKKAITTGEYSSLIYVLTK